MAYSGTHETTKFGERDSGNTILVEISRRGAPPTLTSIRTGGLDWRTIEHSVAQPSSLESLVQQLTEVAQPGSTLVRMHLDGILFPEDRDALKRLDEILTSRFLFGALEATGLTPAPDGEGGIESLPAGTSALSRRASRRTFAPPLGSS